MSARLMSVILSACAWSRRGPRGRDAEELGDSAFQEAALAGEGDGAVGVLLRDHLEQGRVGEVSEDEMVETHRDVRQLGLFPRAEATLQHAHALGVERPQNAGRG